MTTQLGSRYPAQPNTYVSRGGFINGRKYQFHCGEERGIGYYLMGLLPLVLFGKVPTKIVFTVFLVMT